ncbi:hypothetical protein ACFL08_03440 [Patescibacteria group bacterium]
MFGLLIKTERGIKRNLILILVFIAFSVTGAAMWNYLSTGNVFKCKPKEKHYPWLLSIDSGFFATFVMWIAMSIPK